MKAKELKEMSLEQLKGKMGELLLESHHRRMNRGNADEKTHRFAIIRRMVARIKTELHERSKV